MAKTDRERMYIAALEQLSTNRRSLTIRPAVDAYTAGMLALHQAYPHDVEASAFYALSLLADVAPGDTSLVKERKALAILVPLFETTSGPSGVGALHHSYLRYAGAGPAGTGGGAGVCADCVIVAACTAHAGAHLCAAGNVAGGHRFEPGISRGEQEGRGGAACRARTINMHADEFLLYAYLQTGQDGKAKADGGWDQSARRPAGCDAGHGRHEGRCPDLSAMSFRPSTTWRCGTGRAHRCVGGLLRSRRRRLYRRHMGARNREWPSEPLRGRRGPRRARRRFADLTRSTGPGVPTPRFRHLS